MERLEFAGTLIRILRLEKNWSQETLCGGICAVSYLSKIEQGRVVPNPAMRSDLFRKLGYVWQGKESEEINRICEEAYEAIFSGNDCVTKACKAMLMHPWENETIGPWYLDLFVLRAYCSKDLSLIPEQMTNLLNSRQSSMDGSNAEKAVSRWWRYNRRCALWSCRTLSVSL